jgi:hypothetical protein
MPTDTQDHSTAFSARAFFFCCHKQTEQIVEKKNKILNLSQHTSIIEQKAKGKLTRAQYSIPKSPSSQDKSPY